MERLLVAGCLASTWFMAGLIWFVQGVHYPLFHRVGRADFREYHRGHVRRTTWVVLGPMVLELLTSIGLVLRPPPGSSGWLLSLGLLTCGVCWLSTAVVQVPQHERLSSEPEPAFISRLVRSNRIRTVGWTVHALIMSTVSFG